LQRSVSATRLQRYTSIAAGDAAQALRLYMWNTALSEALYGPLQGLEITLRNKIHERLTSAYGTHWYDNSRLQLRHTQQEQLGNAKQMLGNQGKPIEPARVLAELSFGFWVGLLSPKYETHLWRPHLRPLFANALPPFIRKDAHKALDEIRFLRNRIAHHEPILQRRLPEEHQLILTVIQWFCSETASWVGHHSRFAAVYAARP
jgi:hypothetical protein